MRKRIEQLAWLTRSATIGMAICILGCVGDVEQLSAGDETESRSPRATVVGGVIHRDAETRSSIDSTDDVPLPADAAGSLTLVVTKSRYRLDVLHDGIGIKTFPVALGVAPRGPKQVVGDGRTPEGEYILLPHHESPAFGTCFYVCYPNELDARRALESGIIDQRTHDRISRQLALGARPPEDTALGGLILLHGSREPFPEQTMENWTLGCIAMDNEHLRELLDLYKSTDRPRLLIRP